MVDFKGKFKGLLKEAMIGENVPQFMCLIRNLAKIKGITASELTAMLLTGDYVPTKKEISDAGKACIDAGKFRTVTDLKSTFAKVRKGYEGKSIFWVKVEEKVGGKKVIKGTVKPK